MTDYKISLSGDLGSGKSTVGEILTNKYNLEKVSIGDILRKMASEYHMDVIEFNKYMEKHPEFDELVDNKLKEYESVKGNFLFDSRMAWHFVPSSFKVYMKAEVETSAKRILKADRTTENYKSLDEAVEQIKKRRASEKVRYQNLYGVDIMDMANYDLVIKTDDKTPKELAQIICEEFEKFLTKGV